MKTVKEKKKELRKYNTLCKKINLLEERRAEMWLGSIASLPCTDKTPSGAPDGTKTERFVEKMDKLEADIKKLNAERIRLKEKIEAAIDKLKSPQARDVMKEIYLSGSEADIEELSLKINYSLRHIYRIHKKALEKIEL